MHLKQFHINASTQRYFPLNRYIIALDPKKIEEKANMSRNTSMFAQHLLSHQLSL